MMAHRMGCEANDLFAAVAAQHGQMLQSFNCNPKNSSYLLPYMNVWGTNDTFLPGLLGQDADGWYYLTVTQVQQRFAKHNGCNMNDGMNNVKTVSDGIKQWKCSAYNTNCTNNITGTLLCQWNGEHEYALTSEGYNFGMDAVWQFLSQFDRRSNYIGNENNNNTNNNYNYTHSNFTFGYSTTGDSQTDGNNETNSGSGEGNGNNGLSEGGKIGIVVACIFVVLCIVAGVFYWQKKRTDDQALPLVDDE